ncbi:uncharacterized protein B0H18DRAFT_1096021 [Fomitopsis serialis]|uniref:uncharacterized protein n=1 Tax=Fomitopsis serialis TaxID=139415 RepID=UPI0020077733|nr:uncharacterized protein B0H18DRAFT_1096021 [Neoantrodia serialis]KAH9919903.1 hypothetical protein B0H18DRAFT_1096021 [Neoantrodia serialis]
MAGYVPIVCAGSHWCDRSALENVVVFGDSYSKSDDGRTWVGHLGKRLQRRDTPIRIHNFAFPSATAEYDLSTQFSSFFDLCPPKTDIYSGIPTLDPEKTVYCINDCGNPDSDDLASILETIFDGVHDLYIKAGARNFVLIDVPPTDRSPQANDCETSDEIEERVRTWNDALLAQTTEFGASTEQATTLLFSSHRVLTEVLDDPCEFDFTEDDATAEGGGIWTDGLHLSTHVHDILAERLMASVFPP